MEWVFVIQTALFLGAIFAVMHRNSLDRKGEAVRMAALADNAMQYLAAKSLADKVTAQGIAMSQDLQMSYLQDTIAKSEVLERKKAPQEPVLARTETGQEINLNEYDVLS